jgi:hypothetical protein
LKPVVRSVHAVLATGTLVAAPCKCSMMMWLIAEGHASNDLTSVRMASSPRSITNCAFQ